MNKEVSIILPVRNERKYISRCLYSILSQDYPEDKVEVLVVDGMSDDGTRDFLKEYTQKHKNIRIIDNPDRIVPKALNIGIKNAKGDVIIRMDAHAAYAADYVTKCVDCLNRTGADIVGGICFTLPGDDTIIGKSIAFTLSHPFGVGNSYFRIGLKEPRFVDALPFGCYRREVFEKIGLFNENLVRNQDIEFYSRLKRAGGRVLLAPDIVSHYYACSTLKAFTKNNFRNGFWVFYSLKFAPKSFSLRHIIPVIFVFSLIVSLFLLLFYTPFLYLFLLIAGMYLIANVFFSIKVSLKKDIKLLPFVMVSFFTLHFSYGLGSIWGIIKYIFTRGF